MEKIKYNNQYYTISVDDEKNRMIVQPKGFWRSVQVVPNYLHDIDTIYKRFLRKDFMVILDISEMLTHPQEVQEKIHQVASRRLLEERPKQVVIVLPQDDISLMQAKFMSRNLGIELKGFATFEEANSFLDAYCEKHGL